jgi:hypothetical protein
LEEGRADGDESGYFHEELAGNGQTEEMQPIAELLLQDAE